MVAKSQPMAKLNQNELDAEYAVLALVVFGVKIGYLSQELFCAFAAEFRRVVVCEHIGK